MWFFLKRKDVLKDNFVKEAKKEKIDMKGLFSNINNRNKVELLYKELCRLSHPDNNPDKQELAQELFTKVQNSRNDYNAMLKLKDEITESLIQK